MMNAEDKALWINALRSGEYKQTDSFLEHEGRFCCLGVLCKVKNVRRTEDETGFVEYHFGGDFDNMSGTMPVGQFGLDSEVLVTVIHMNDSLSRSFDQIADYLEKTV